MSESLGRSVGVSRGRRYICDLLHAGMQIPLVTIQKDINVADVLAARRSATPRPSWCSIFTKAYAKVVASRPDMRRVFLTFPWERIYEYQTTSADITMEVRVGDEDILAFIAVHKPETLPLAEIDRIIAEARDKPLERLDRLLPALRLACFPRFLRRFVWWCLLNLSAKMRSDWFGTFGVTSVGNWSVESVRPIAPAMTILHYGAIDDEGNVSLRLTYDHRVHDGSGPARALNEMEQFLKTDLLAELQSLRGPDPQREIDPAPDVMGMPMGR